MQQREQTIIVCLCSLDRVTVCETQLSLSVCWAQPLEKVQLSWEAVSLAWVSSLACIHVLWILLHPSSPASFTCCCVLKKIPPELYESGQIRINPMTQGPPHSSTSIHFRKIYKDQIKTHSNGCVSFRVPAEIKIAFLKHISGLIGNNILFHVTEVKCVVNVISRELIIMDYYNKNTVLAQYVVCIKNICILSTIICHMSTPFHYRFVVDMTLNSIAPCTQGPPLKNNTFIAEWILRLRHKEAEFHFKLLSQWTFVLKIHTRSKQGWRCAIYPYTIHQNKPCENKQVYLAY